MFLLCLERVLFNDNVLGAPHSDATIVSTNSKLDFALLINKTSHTAIACDCPKYVETVVKGEKEIETRYFLKNFLHKNILIYVL